MIDLSKYSEIIIWGASFPPGEVGDVATSHGHSMEKLANLLKKKNAWERVVAIVDSNSAVQGKMRLGIVVSAPISILEHSEALVIINSISICSIKAALCSLGAKNDCAVIPYYFYHGTLDYPYDNKVAQDDAIKYMQKIKELYEMKDTKTKKYLDIIMSMRINGEDELQDVSFYEGTGENMAYFCDSELSPKRDVTYIDVGAFDGDSLAPVENFYKGRLKRYYGFEPDKKSMEKLKTYVQKSKLAEKTVLFPYALGESDGKIRFSVSGSTSQESEYGEVMLEQKKFDNLEGIEIIGDAMIKMDIEGAELGALKGMQEFIRRHTPYLAICLYHKEHDLWEIANYIKQQNARYRLYIRGGWHLECWAIPQRHFD